MCVGGVTMTGTGNYEEDWRELYHNALCFPFHCLRLSITSSLLSEGALQVTNHYWPVIMYCRLEFQ